MRILRVRRGFTTNSSGADEFVPRPKDSAMDGGARPPSVTAVTGKPEAPAPVPPSGGNATTLGILALVVAALFLVQRVVRAVLKKLRKEKHEQSPGPDAE